MARRGQNREGWLPQAISKRNVANARFRTVPFEGAWKDCIGCPEIHGSWIIWGTSGQGKTSFALRLSKYLSQWERVAYDSLEQGLSLSLQKSWIREGLPEVGSRVVLLDKEPVERLRERLARRKSPGVVFIESLTALPGFKKKDYVDLTGSFPTKLFVFLAHEKRGMPDPAIAETVRRLSDVKIFVDGFKAYPTTRYEDAAAGEGGQPFIIWPERANARFCDNV